MPSMTAVAEPQEFSTAAEVGEVLRVPLSRAQVVLLERAAVELDKDRPSAMRRRGLARELRAIAALWRALKLAESQDAGVADAARRWRELAGLND